MLLRSCCTQSRVIRSVTWQVLGLGEAQQQQQQQQQLISLHMPMLRQRRLHTLKIDYHGPGTMLLAFHTGLYLCSNMMPHLLPLDNNMYLQDFTAPVSYTQAPDCVILADPHPHPGR